MFPQNALGFAQMVMKIEWGVAYLEKVQSNTVKKPSAELELAENFDTICTWLDGVIQVKDKRQLRIIFEGKNTRLLAHLRTLCEQVELKVSSDKRRTAVFDRLKSVEEVLADLGYAEEIRQAKINEECARKKGREEQESPVQDVVPHLAEAAFFGAQAVALEGVKEFDGAVDSYNKATASLRAAVAVCRAVVKFKASINQESTLEKDADALHQLEQQTYIRIEHLQGLEPGATPIPVEEQIDPVNLSIHTDLETQQKLMRAYVGYSASIAAAFGGLFLSGPFGLLLVAGGIVGSVIIAQHKKHEEKTEAPKAVQEVGQVLVDMGDVVVDGIATSFMHIQGSFVKPDAEAARSDDSAARPDASAALSDIAEAMPDVSAALTDISEAPAARPDAPAARPDASAARPFAPAARSDDSAARPEAPAARSDDSAARPAAPAARSDDSAARPEAPAARPDAPPTRTDGPLLAAEAAETA